MNSEQCTEYGVADVGEHVAGRAEAHEGRHLLELEDLRRPLGLVREVEVRAELDLAPAALLALTAPQITHCITCTRTVQSASPRTSSSITGRSSYEYEYE